MLIFFLFEMAFAFAATHQSFALTMGFTQKSDNIHYFSEKLLLKYEYAKTFIPKIYELKHEVYFSPEKSA